MLGCFWNVTQQIEGQKVQNFINCANITLLATLLNNLATSPPEHLTATNFTNFDKFFSLFSNKKANNL